MRFIKNKHNKEIVNLDLVTNILPDTCRYGDNNQLFFMYSNNTQVVWLFDKLEDMEDVLSKIEVLEV